MKTIASPRVFVLACASFVLPASAQNLGFSDLSASGLPRAPWADGSVFEAPGLPATADQIPAVRHAEPSVQPSALLVNGTSAKPLAEQNRGKGGEAVKALDISAALDSMAKHPAQPSMAASVEELQLGLALLTSVYRPQGEKVASADCPMLALVIERRVASDPSKVLEIVETEIALNPNCACEIVKAAIKGSDADSTTVAAIVETGCVAAPDMMRIISQCAIASAPTALPEVQAVLVKLDPNAGRPGNSSKSAKGAKAKIVIPPQIPVAANPLDLPPVGPPIIPPYFPPPVTSVVRLP